ncbi:MAG: hypothetical protein IPM24_07950 [Bryobacterales bacterium]|nr:hypothetical protein [Bryobacterales bacterium]
MSFSDHLENDLKNLEGFEERRAANARPKAKPRMDPKQVQALAALNDKLRNGRFTADLLRTATRVGHGYRTKVRMTWLGPTLRLEAREHRLDLRAEPDGVRAHFSVDGQEQGTRRVDLDGSGEEFARNWMEAVGPAPPPAPVPELDAD